MNAPGTITTKGDEVYAVLPRIVAKGAPQKRITETIYKLVMYVFSLVDIRTDDLSGKRIKINVQDLNKHMGRKTLFSADVLQRAKKKDVIFSDKKTNVKIFSEIGDFEGNYFVVLHDSLIDYIQENKDKENMFFKVDIKPVLQMNTKKNYYTLMMYVYLSIYLEEKDEKLIKNCLCEAGVIKAALGVENYNIYLLKKNVLSRITEIFNKEPYSKIFVTYEINGHKVELFVAKKKYFSDYDDFFNETFNRAYGEGFKEKIAYMSEQDKTNEDKKYNGFVFGLFTGIFVGGIVGGIISALL